MQGITYTDWLATAKFSWLPSQFPEIIKCLHVQPVPIPNTNSIKFLKQYPYPYNCTVEFHPSGQILFMSPEPEPKLEEILGLEIIGQLVEGLPDVEITLVEGVRVEGFAALVRYEDFQAVDMGMLRGILEVQFGVQYQQHSQVVQLPEQVHRIEEVTILILETYAKILNANLIEDLNLMKYYLETILQPFAIKPKTKLENLL